jgi:hypothetical protein
MDVDVLIRYSDDRLCEVAASRPDDGTPLYHIATRREELGATIELTMWEARRLFETEPWPARPRSH